MEKRKKQIFRIMSISILVIAISAIVFPMLMDTVNDAKYKKYFDIQLPYRNAVFLQSIRSSEPLSEKPATTKINKDISKANTIVKQPITTVSTDLWNFNQAMTPVWVVQVATFQNKAHATKLQQALQKMNYHAYDKQELTPTGVLYRVYIGPIIEYRLAQATNMQIEQQLALKGTVKYYEPL